LRTTYENLKEKIMGCSVACVGEVKGAVDAAMKVSAVRKSFAPGPIETLIAQNNGMQALNNLPQLAIDRQLQI
jgi:hypothetical protein